MLKNCIIISARYNSKRLFGKPLYKLKPEINSISDFNKIYNYKIKCI